ncbi:MAG: DUF1565 domain-containing protein, partial [Candidatus Cloacimonetes bacterium]|nr:DUF1565 domain-containing protein [Candidatus Cloacimonadota bacterium]
MRPVNNKHEINTLRLPLGAGGGLFTLQLIAVWALCIFCVNTHAAILGVALDGSQPYGVIQEAIDASAHGDTVLVYPGRYIENVRFNGKNITLASLELLSGDRDYIHSTVIDGNQNGSVIVSRDHESNICIRGFTVTNGSGSLNTTGTSMYGGGIIISNMTGSRQAFVSNCIVTGNKADSGGGICGSGMIMHLSGVSIHRNTAGSGGGIWYYGSSINSYNTHFDPDNRCSIYSNYAAFGSDMYFYQVNTVHVVVDTFTVANPWNFYATAIPQSPNITNPYTFDILHTVHEEVNHDLFVAPWGDDSNSGLSPDQPLWSIFKAMYNIASDSENPKTVYVANGHYSPSLNGQQFPIPSKSNTSLVGESREGTVLDAEFLTHIHTSPPDTHNWHVMNFSMINGKSGCAISRSAHYSLSNLLIDNHISNFTVGIDGTHNYGNMLFKDIKISRLSSDDIGTVLEALSSSGELTINNLEITDCEAPYLSAIHISAVDELDLTIDGLELHNNRCVSSDQFAFNSMFQISPWDDNASRLRIDIRNSAFYDNYQNYGNPMSMARAWNDTLFITNCTFAGNTGGGVPLCVQGTSILTNNILHNPGSVYQILVPNNTSSGIFSSLTLYNNNILGGYYGWLSETAQNPVWWLTGNSDVDPLFIGEGNRPYLLSPLSPLIDTGRQAASGVVEDSKDAAGNERYWDGDGDGISIIDVGAYEYQPIYQPIDLMAEATDRQIFLSWQMQAPERGLSGFRIYRNGAAYADILDPSAYAFRDYSAEEDTLYYYLTALYGSVESASSNTVMVILNSSANEDEQSVSGVSKLSVSPNPFSELAVITYELDKQSDTELKVYNLKGQQIRTLNKGMQS